jgi:hypothetical protein
LTEVEAAPFVWAQVEVRVLVVVEHRPESPSWSSSGERAWLGMEGDDAEKEIREREDVLCGAQGRAADARFGSRGLDRCPSDGPAPGGCRACDPPGD